ncbi:PTH1 family peptidyl-tRNA hydrolase [Natronospira proteinivora]|uniref:Peptidyl-tRNA hydrolase n=1 Tax=Natronospira proteinivora TaxID=1807133 RepID=A0ABT1G7S8_9GAMM|nr:aminoacyl-tRNA hydrolase [Natronospira proteinivora]MCP1727356.1 PTH1 family peptidyl-tRNA hydrolase [Natronospira proteinivora]
MSERIKLVVGLGNPGADYVSTRHNAGFWLVDELADRHGGRFTGERKFHGEICKVFVGAHEVRLLKPMTFMNRSGQSVRAVMDFFKLRPEEILVAHDELDLPPGVIRLKWSGGHGGHNGLRDLHAHVGKDYRRLRIGIGHPGHASGVVGYVLKRPSSEDEARIREGIIAAAEALPAILDDGLEAGMNRLHTRTE